MDLQRRQTGNNHNALWCFFSKLISRCREMFFSTLCSSLFVPQTSNKHTWLSIGGTGRHLQRVCLYWLQPHCPQSPAVQKWSAKSFGENLGDDHDGASLFQNSHSGSSTTWKAERCCLSKILFPEALVCFVLCWIVGNGNTSTEVSLLSMCGFPEPLIPKWSRCVFSPADRAVRFLSVRQRCILNSSHSREWRPRRTDVWGRIKGESIRLPCRTLDIDSLFFFEGGIILRFFFFNLSNPCTSFLLYWCE